MRKDNKLDYYFLSNRVYLLKKLMFIEKIVKFLKKKNMENQNYYNFGLSGFMFLDPTTSFGEGLILLYHRIFSVLCLVVTLVLVLLVIINFYYGRFDRNWFVFSYNVIDKITNFLKLDYFITKLGVLATMIFDINTYEEKSIKAYFHQEAKMKGFDNLNDLQESSEYKNMEYAWSGTPISGINVFSLSSFFFVFSSDMEEDSNDFGIGIEGQQWSWELAYSLTIFVPVVMRWDFLYELYTDGESLREHDSIELLDALEPKVDWGASVMWDWDFNNINGYQDKYSWCYDNDWKQVPPFLYGYYTREVYYGFFEESWKNATLKEKFEIWRKWKGGGLAWYRFFPISIGFDYVTSLVKEDDLMPGESRLETTDNEMLLPIDTSIDLGLSSKDVLHSFYIPSSMDKKDAMPGRSNTVIVNFKKPGLQTARCAELCGPEHGFMPMTVNVIDTKKLLDSLGFYSEHDLLVKISLIKFLAFMWIEDPNEITRENLVDHIEEFLEWNSNNAEKLGQYYNMDIPHLCDEKSIAWAKARNN